MPLIQTEEAARRLARAIASDLSLYNEEKIVNGITNDNLFDSLSEEIEEGRALYKRRVSPELYPRNFYDRALVDILIKAKGHIKSNVGCGVNARAPAPPATRALPEEGIAFRVLHRDDAVLVLDKPPGLVVHPARGHAS